jgi:2-alkenal reductase
LVNLRLPRFLEPSSGAQPPTAVARVETIVPAQAAESAQPAAEAATAVPTPTAVPDSLRAEYDAQEQVLINLYERVNPAVVFISIGSEQITNQGTFTLPSGTGSGFVVDTRGHIVTNNHVIDGADQIDVTFADGRTERAEVVGADAFSDLAVIRVNVPAEDLSVVELGDSTGLKPGQRVIAIGNPFGLAGTMTEGIISAVGRTLPESSGDGSGGTFINPDVIQTDAAINPGNSGGPLLDSRGRVIGINTAIRTASASPTGQASNSGIGFAVPVNTIKRIVPELIETGRVRYPYLGITSRDGFKLAEIADRLKTGLPVTEGVLVFDVSAGGPAAKAGLRGGSEDNTTVVRGMVVPLGGDIITALSGVPVKDFSDMISKLTANHRVGERVTLSILRDGKPMEVEVTLGERPR